MDSQVRILVIRACSNQLGSIQKNPHTTGGERARIQDVHGVRRGAGWLVKKAFHQLIRRRRLGVVAGRGGADDLVNLVAVHVRLLTKRLRHRNKRAGDSCARRRMFAKQAGLQDRLLAVHITRERLRI